MSLQNIAEQTAAFGRNHGDSVREKRIGTGADFSAPTRIFMMYLRFDRDSCLHVSHYRDELGDRSIKAAEAALMREARPSHPGQKDHRVARNFEDMKFEAPCYFTVILDEARWEFYDDPAVPGNPPLVFLERKPGDLSGTSFDPNNSFYDAETLHVLGRPALRCINFCRNNAAGEPSKFCFEMNLRAPFALKGSERYITMIIDPTGENKGPS